MELNTWRIHFSECVLSTNGGKQTEWNELECSEPNVDVGRLAAIFSAHCTPSGLSYIRYAGIRQASAATIG
jgi:hypothetical protein